MQKIKICCSKACCSNKSLQLVLGVHITAAFDPFFINRTFKWFRKYFPIPNVFMHQCINSFRGRVTSTQWNILGRCRLATQELMSILGCKDISYFSTIEEMPRSLVISSLNGLYSMARKISHPFPWEYKDKKRLPHLGWQRHEEQTFCQTTVNSLSSHSHTFFAIFSEPFNTKSMLYIVVTDHNIPIRE